MTAVLEVKDLNQRVGERAHTLMFRRRLTQVAVAPLMGTSQANLSRKLRGEVVWTVEDLVRIAAVLDVEPGELLPRLDSNQQPSGYPTPQVIAGPWFTREDIAA